MQALCDDFVMHATAPRFMFDRDTATLPVLPLPRPESSGESSGSSAFLTYSANISTNWDSLEHHPNGGYLVSIVLSAIEKVLPHPHPLVLSAWFISAANHGKASIKVRKIKESRSRSSAEAILYQLTKLPSKEGGQEEEFEETERLRLTTIFTNLEAPNGMSLELGGPHHPRQTTYHLLPPIEQCTQNSSGATLSQNIQSYYDPAVSFQIKGDHCERRMHMRFLDGRQPDVKSLALFADCSLPAVLTLNVPRMWVPTLEYTVYFRGVPGPGPLKVFSQSRHLTNGYVEEDFDVLDCQGRLVAQSHQLALVFSAKRSQNIKASL